ncbi:hypothetical protein EQG41_18360 [Billgrantia azerbaijanica]|nr:hypothetical protein EQG41_18360 [Halomonas azerbaijanica]
MGWADSAADGATGGRGGYGGGAGGGRGGGGFDGRDTPGSPNAADGKRGSSMGRDGGRAGDAGGDGSTGGWASNVDAQMGPGNAGYGTNAESVFGGWANETQTVGGQSYGAISRDGLTAAQSASARSRAHRGSRSALSTGLGILGGVVGGVPGAALGLGLSSMIQAKNVTDSLDAVNDTFGTSHDTSFGRAARESLGINAVGKLGGNIGARLGVGLLSSNPVAGAVLGGMTLGSMAKNAAIDGVGSPSSPASPGRQGGDGGGRPRTGGLLANEITRSRAEPAVQSSAVTPSPVSGYGSYAESFFS